MHDLAVLVPSRGRPENLKRLIDAVHATGAADTHVIAGIDYDDPRFTDYMALKDSIGPGDAIYSDERMNLVQWTNRLAEMTAGEYRFYASLGDDMVPRTKGWDTKLTGAIDEHFGGTGITYPWDGVRDDIPEAYVLSADIPDRLGWVMLPALTHWYNDNVIADLGHEAGCIRQLRGVIVEHLNVGLGRAPVDPTAVDAGQRIQEDQATYEAWARDPRGRLADVATIKLIRARAA
jgi:hypothetical protein